MASLRPAQLAEALFETVRHSFRLPRLSRRAVVTSRSKPASTFVLLIGLVFLLSACIGANADVVHKAPYGNGPRIKGLPGFSPPHPSQSLAYIINPAQVTPEPNGDYLVTDVGSFNRSGGKVVEFSPQGRVTWAYINPTLDFPHSAYPTTRGNVLITDTNNNRVIEVDRSGRIVWNTDNLNGGHGFLGRGRLSDGSQLLYPNDAKELPNGHYLISSRMNSTVFEVDRNGHVYWKCHSFLNLQGKPDHLLRQHNPQRLPNGDTLISDSDNGRIVIVNRNCTRMVWEYDQKTPTGGPQVEWPRDATLLKNGDILIDDSIHNRVIEVNWKKETVRKYYDIPMPYSAWPLPNGLVAVGNPNTHGIVFWGPGAPQAAPMYMIPPRPARPPFPVPPLHLVNGGCETQPVLGWQQNDLLTETLPPGVRADMGMDPSVAHSGLSSCRITWNEPTPHEALNFAQVVRVHPYRWYQLSGYVMTKDVRLCQGCNFGVGSDPGNSAYISYQLIRLSPWANPTSVDLTKHMGTTTTWVHDVSPAIYMPQGTWGINIALNLVGKGTVWFDDIKLRELKKRLQPGT
ncbi:MAG TPA: hypothetical protein VFB34_10365 [Chloroflexota bacterium]|nr:hypothetical protein [Chloroflexota bacterium]